MNWTIIIFVLCIVSLFTLFTYTKFEYFCDADGNCNCDGCSITYNADGNCEWINKTEKCCPQYCKNTNGNNNTDCQYDKDCEDCGKWTKWSCSDSGCSLINNKLYNNNKCVIIG
jgi:hypothetical protein